MKRLLLIACIVATASVAFGQKKAPKPKLNKIEAMLIGGEIAGAKDMADAAIVDEKLKNDPKTYYLRGLVYVAIDTSSVHNTLAEDPMSTALESFKKAEEMNVGTDKELFVLDGGFPVTLSQHKQSYWTYYFNKGADGFGTQDYLYALENFEQAQKISPEDSNSYINAGYAAHNAQEFEKAKTNYAKALSMGIKDRDIHNLYVYILNNVDKNYDEALEWIGKARDLYPTDTEFARIEIDLLYKTDRVEEAKNNLVSAIENEPTDPNLYFMLGIFYDNLQKKDDNSAEDKAEFKEGAREAYTKAMGLDPEHYPSTYNYGVMLIDDANEVIKERNNLGISNADLKRVDELEPLINEMLENALPVWEKVREMKPDDLDALNTLKYLYSQLKKYDEAEEVISKIEELGG
ncbi:MAG: hypothetical protein JXQ90_03915 [Cyclobacteriaceae bacterium]